MRMVLFTGKGGVGKTTLAAATAAHLARSGRKTLTVSTDPAHSLGDALEAELGGEPTEVDGVGGLFAAHVDARALLEGAWGRLRDHLATVLAGAGVDELVADELTVLPGVEELLALAAVQRAAQAGPWDVVVVDCGPTAETLRLLALPEAVGGYLERLFPAHRRALRGLMTRDRSDARRWDRTVEALDGLAGELADLHALLASPQTGIRLVLTPERVVAAETRRTLTALALLGLHVDGLVANRMVPVPPPDAPGEAARWLRERGGEQAAVLADLERLGTPLGTVEYTAAEPTGVEALLVLAAQLWGDDDPAVEQPPATPLLAVRRTSGSGRSLDSEFELALHLPGATSAPLDLARIGDELAVTVAGLRRLVALPAVLRRCTVIRARLDGDDLRVAFRPDPALWLR
ncbi:ArsA family ATPase [Pseudonocardia charpentierae]|uniref:ArsA family ATPase n=1 Tax=Pseudonocardia charpentierae TaxID=3075545 RepID=A0ABU2NAW7_9PSEU|nr:ArsA family ATPase [Pseudonocardia sp. DSM 45834]MDT0350623.1 ArsA family ATPase [Pseudonocardia sp. DSM 45834]